MITAVLQVRDHARHSDDMLLRLGCLLVAVAAGLYAGFIADGASAARQALRLTEHAQSSELPVAVRLSLLRSARNKLAAAWSRPLAWHAGALEVNSGGAFLESQLARSAPLERLSAQSAARSVRLSPIQPAAWFRLALLDRLGVRNGQCEAATCLANSWRSGSVVDAQLACDRLQLARLTGVALEVRDRRIAWYAAARPPRRDIVSCLGAFPRESIFYALLKQREATARAHGE